MNYVDLLGLDAEAVKQVVNNPQNWEAALRGATTAYLNGKSAVSSGAAAGGGAVAASSLVLPLLGVGLATAIACYFTLKTEDYFIEEKYRVRVQMENGVIPYEHHPDDDEMGDRNFVGPSIDDTFNSLRNQNKGPDIDKINRDIQRDAYGKNNNIGQTPEEAIEELTETEVGTGDTSPARKKGDKTLGGRIYTKHSAERAIERDFTDQIIDNIVNNNRKGRVKQTDPRSGEQSWRYQDKRGNTVVVNMNDEIVTVYSYPKHVNDGNYIPKCNK